MKDQVKIQQLKTALKQLLKKRGVKYQDLARELDCSYVTVKRIMGQEELTLSRLLQICDFLNVNLSELETLASEQGQKLKSMTLEQEKFFVKNQHFLSYMFELREGQQPDQIAKKFELNSLSSDKYLLQLEKLGLIGHTTKNRVKVLVDVNRWGKGPLARAFNKAIFFKSAEFFTEKGADYLHSVDENKEFISMSHTLEHVKISKESFDHWRKEMDRVLKQFFRVCEMEEKIKDPNELNSAVFVSGHVVKLGQDESFKQVESIFDRVRNI